MDEFRSGRDHTRPGFLLVLPWDLVGYGGVDTATKGLYRALETAGRFQPQVLAAVNDPTKTAAPPGYRISGMRLCNPYSSRRLRSLIAFLRTLPIVLLKLHHLIKVNNIRVINPHFVSLFSFVFVIARKLFDVELVLSFHGSDVAAMRKAGPAERRWWLGLLKPADYLVVPSRALGDDIRLFAPVVQDRIRVIAHGIDASNFRAIAFDSDVKIPAAPYLLIVGSFAVLDDGRFLKGYDLLFETWPKIVARHPELRLVIVGASSPNANRAREFAARNQNVSVFEDQPRAAVSRLMSSAAALLLLSRAVESFGLALIEAGAHGLPIIATTVGGIPEVVREGIDGILIPPDDPHALADAVDRIVADPALGRRLGDNLRSRVETEFTWERAADRYANLASAPRLEEFVQETAAEIPI